MNEEDAFLKSRLKEEILHRTRTCRWCGEYVEKDDPRVIEGSYPMHYECEARSVLGSVAHQKKECSCYGGSGEDDPKLTRRQAALAALVFWQSGREMPDSWVQENRN